MKVGIIGLSEGNGHPFSFSSIINGFNKDAVVNAGWGGIASYLLRQSSVDIGIDGVSVTHAWTQDTAITAQLCEACYIENPVDHYEHMIGSVDAVILARDDFECHYEIAKVFLEVGIPVFVDKPLTLNLSELEWFLPYLKSGKLMSCSGFRFARELDEIRASQVPIGDIKLINAVVLNGWEKYGIHMLDLALGISPARPLTIKSDLNINHDHMSMRLDDESILRVSALGNVGKTFRFDVFGSRDNCSFEIHDNFTAFRRCLNHFFHLVNTGEQAIPWQDTCWSICTLIAGVDSKKTGAEVSVIDLMAKLSVLD